MGNSDNFPVGFLCRCVVKGLPHLNDFSWESTSLSMKAQLLVTGEDWGMSLAIQSAQSSTGHFVTAEKLSTL